MASTLSDAYSCSCKWIVYVADAKDEDEGVGMIA